MGDPPVQHNSSVVHTLSTRSVGGERPVSLSRCATDRRPHMNKSSRTRSRRLSHTVAPQDAYTVDPVTDLAIHRYVRVPDEAMDDGGVVHVNVASHWLNITEIDSVKQCFDACVWIQLSYFIHGVPKSKIDESKVWKPELTFLNLVKTKDPKNTVRVVDSQTGTTIFVTYQLRGTFAVKFDLATFPIDSQMLRIEAVLWRSPYEAVTSYGPDGEPETSVQFKGRVEFHQENSMVYMEHFVLADCWRIVENVTVWSGVTDEKRRGNNDGIRHSMLNISIVVARNPAFFFWNAGLPFFLFVVLSFISLCKSGLTLGDKAQITLPMVLTAAAYKIVMNGYMPTVSYLTLLDTYILLCFVYLFFVACQNCIVTLLVDSSHLDKFQDGSALVIAGSWLLLHAVVPIKLLAQQRKGEREHMALAVKEVRDEGGGGRRSSIAPFTAANPNASRSGIATGDLEEGGVGTLKSQAGCLGRLKRSAKQMGGNSKVFPFSRLNDPAPSHPNASAYGRNALANGNGLSGGAAKSALDGEDGDEAPEHAGSWHRRSTNISDTPTSGAAAGGSTETPRWGSGGGVSTPNGTAPGHNSKMSVEDHARFRTAEHNRASMDNRASLDFAALGNAGFKGFRFGAANAGGPAAGGSSRVEQSWRENMAAHDVNSHVLGDH